MYRITKYSHQQAKRLGVDIKPSKRKGKKIDVFKKGVYIASIGAIGYNDYPTYIAKFGRAYANKRRKLYKIRHKKDRMKKGSAGYYADRILW